MSNGVLVRDSTCVQGSVISIHLPMVALLGQEMEGRWPWSLVDVLCCAISQHGIELSHGHCQTVRSKAAWAAGHWGSRCCVDMVNGVLLNLTVDPPPPGNSARRLSVGAVLAMIVRLGTEVGAVWSTSINI